MGRRGGLVFWGVGVVLKGLVFRGVSVLLRRLGVRMGMGMARKRRR
jgi:hypothetical protein